MTDVAIGSFKIMGGRALGTPHWADLASGVCEPDALSLGSNIKVSLAGLGNIKHTEDYGPSIT